MPQSPGTKVPVYWQFLLICRCSSRTDLNHRSAFPGYGTRPTAGTCLTRCFNGRVKEMSPFDNTQGHCTGASRNARPYPPPRLQSELHDRSRPFGMEKNLVHTHFFENMRSLRNSLVPRRGISRGLLQHVRTENAEAAGSESVEDKGGGDVRHAGHIEAASRAAAAISAPECSRRCGMRTGLMFSFCASITSMRPASAAGLVRYRRQRHEAREIRSSATRAMPCMLRTVAAVAAAEQPAVHAKAGCAGERRALAGHSRVGHSWIARPRPLEGLAFYRKHTVALLHRYMRTSMEMGRTPCVLGKMVFRGRVSSYRISCFEDLVIFIFDVEKCLKRLDAASQAAIAHIALEDFTFEEAAAITGSSARSMARIYGAALDRLTQWFLDCRLLEADLENLSRGRAFNQSNGS